MREKIKQLIQEDKYQSTTGRLGVISSYDPVNNTATVLISGESTDEIEAVLQNVMCPISLGIQEVAPSPGRQCWVVFKNNNITQPLITHYYNYRYNQFDYTKQTQANNALPTYLLGI